MRHFACLASTEVHKISFSFRCTAERLLRPMPENHSPVERNEGTPQILTRVKASCRGSCKSGRGVPFPITSCLLISTHTLVLDDTSHSVIEACAWPFHSKLKWPDTRVCSFGVPGHFVTPGPAVGGTSTVASTHGKPDLGAAECALSPRLLVVAREQDAHRRAHHPREHHQCACGQKTNHSEFFLADIVAGWVAVVRQ